MVNLALGNADNHAKNHALLYTGARAVFAPVYEVTPVLIDDQVNHHTAFDIGHARITDEITPADFDTFIQALGFPRVTPALLSRLRGLVQSLVSRIPEMSGPARKRIGDVMAEQARSLGVSLSMEIDIPERDAFIPNRP